MVLRSLSWFAHFARLARAWCGWPPAATRRDPTCQPGYVDCNGLDSDGCEEGRFGGACELTGPVAASDDACLAVDATAVYFTTGTGGTVRRAALKGGGTVEMLASGQSNPTRIVVAGGDVFRVNQSASGSVMRASVTADAGAPVVLISAVMPTQLAVERGPSVVAAVRSAALIGRASGSQVVDLRDFPRLLLREWR